MGDSATYVDIGQAEALVIARAVARIVSQPHNSRSSTADIVREFVVDGLVALVSEGWELIPPEAGTGSEADDLIPLQPRDRQHYHAHRAVRSDG